MPKQGQLVDRSSSSGRGVMECWIELFEANEKHWREGRIKKVLTDFEQLQQMREWFPQRTALASVKVSRVRGAYNRKRRFIAAFKYIRDGEGCVARATTRGTPISEWKSPVPKPAY